MADMINFTKMHGIGNDFVIIDCRDGIELNEIATKEIANRRFGIGCDQIILLKNPLLGNDIYLEFINNDGSLSSACGNGTRCAAYLILKENSTNNINIETNAGVLKAWKDSDSNLISVNMGKPNFNWNEIPLSKNIDHTNVDLGFDKGTNAFCLSMGNPHAVFFVENIESINVSLFGPKFENHSVFPEKANISFAEIKSESKIKMKVWERGAGQTAACGSGACAVAVAAKQLSKIDNDCEIVLDGGILNVKILDDGSIVLKGPTEISFQGKLGNRISKLIKSN
tara:strand:+ start:295 stop:1143 length:849 start_codon:yes stop_codon:yes gene_type:complete